MQLYDSESSRNRDLHAGGVAGGNRSTEHAFVSVKINFNSWNPSAIEDLPRFHSRDHRLHCFLHVIRLCSSQTRRKIELEIPMSKKIERDDLQREKNTMKRTGSEVLARTAALTASSSFRESMCLSRYSCTDISSNSHCNCFFFFFFSSLSVFRFTLSERERETM